MEMIPSMELTATSSPKGTRPPAQGCPPLFGGLPWVTDRPSDTTRRGGLCQTFLSFFEAGKGACSILMVQGRQECLPHYGGV